MRDRRHAKYRAKQRYGLVYNKKIRREIERMITEQRGIVKSKKHTVTTTIYRVRFNETEYVVLWNKKNKYISTFLPNLNKEGV